MNAWMQEHVPVLIIYTGPIRAEPGALQGGLYA